jgi:hypothetical protein
MPFKSKKQRKYLFANKPNMDGSVDEFRFRASALSDDWIATEYANQNSPSTFVAASEVRLLSHGFINHQNPGIV